MKKTAKITKFFMGAESANGFVSLFNTELYDPQSNWFCYIIKGAAGTGKSSFMRKIAESAQKLGLDTEIVYCSSDPDSLDGVIIPQKKVCIVDGTAPHTQDPILPGVTSSILNFGEFWDDTILKENSETIKHLSSEISKCHKKGESFLTAFGIIENTNQKIIEKHLDIEALNDFSEKLFEKFLHEKFSSTKKNPTEKKRFISGITSKGKVFFEDTLTNQCETIVELTDSYGIISNIILHFLRKNVLSSGFSVISCLCPIFPERKLDCLIIPDKKLAFVAGDTYHKIRNSKKVKIRKFKTSDFINKKSINFHENLLKFNKKIQNAFLKEATKNFSQAKTLHDELEKIYISSMNFNKLDTLNQKITQLILSE